MSDTESSGSSGGLMAIANEEVRPLPQVLCTNGTSEKLEEFQAYFRTMMDSKANSIEAEQPPEEPPDVAEAPPGIILKQ